MVLRQMGVGVDEIHLGQKQKFPKVVSNLQTASLCGLAKSGRKRPCLANRRIAAFGWTKDIFCERASIASR